MTVSVSIPFRVTYLQDSKANDDKKKPPLLPCCFANKRLSLLVAFVSLPPRLHQQTPFYIMSKPVTTFWRIAGLSYLQVSKRITDKQTNHNHTHVS